MINDNKKPQQTEERGYFQQSTDFAELFLFYNKNNNILVNAPKSKNDCKQCFQNKLCCFAIIPTK